MKKDIITNQSSKLINELKIDLACGQSKAEGFFGIDKVPGEKVDAVVDLEVFPWPIESDSVEEIVCNHYVEHTSDLIKFMDEVYRILKPNGKMKIVAPYYTSVRCWQDPTHKRAISDATFFYFNKGWRDANKLDHYPITCDFDFTYGYDIALDWANRSEEARNFAIRHYWNVINDIHVVLTARPKSRQIIMAVTAIEIDAYITNVRTAVTEYGDSLARKQRLGKSDLFCDKIKLMLLSGYLDCICDYFLQYSQNITDGVTDVSNYNFFTVDEIRDVMQHINNITGSFYILNNL